MIKIKCEAIIDFTLKDFNKLKNIVRKNKSTDGMIYKGDIFECDEQMGKYLSGDNPKERKVVNVLEVIPEIVANLELSEEEIEPKVEIKLEKPKKKKSSRKKKEE